MAACARNVALIKCHVSEIWRPNIGFGLQNAFMPQRLALLTLYIELSLSTTTTSALPAIQQAFSESSMTISG